LHCRQEAIYAVTTEITEISQMELALQESYRWFNSLIRASLEGVWVLSRAGETAFVNQRMADLLGYSPEEMQGQQAGDFVELEERSQFIQRLQNRQQGIDQRLDQGLDEQYEVQLQRRDRTLVWVAISAHGMYGSEGECLGSLGMVTDISERKHSEEQLRELKDTLQTIIQSSPLAIIALDSQGKVKLWNRSAEKMFGWPEQEVLGNFLPPSRDKLDQFSQLLDTNESASFADLETRYYRQDGSAVDISLSTAPLHDAEGRVIGNMGIAADITLVKQMQESLLQQAQREKLVSTIAQRIRQSLDLQEILDTTVLEVQNFLHSDRVLIIHFLRNDQGNVVAEALGSNAVSSIASMRGFLLNNPFLNMVNNFDRYYNGGALALDDVEQAELAEDSSRLLEFFQVKSMLVVPILQQQSKDFNSNYQTAPRSFMPQNSESKNLWGFLMVHQCRGLRHWEAPEINLLKQLATQVSIALWQGRLYQQAKIQAGREKTLNRVTKAIRCTLDLKTIFSTAVWEIGNQLRSQRVEIWQYSTPKKVWQNVSEYRGNLDTPVRLGTEIRDQDNSVTLKLKQLKIVKNRPLTPALEQPDLVSKVAYLLVPLHFGEQVWGALALVMDGYIYDWQEEQVEFMAQVADQLSIAIQQSELYLQLQEANKKLQQLAATDGLTQVANRRYFDETLHDEWQRLTREKLPLALILIDIDWFKPYNDHYGHQAGDDCLRQVARAIAQVLKRPADLLARYGGEEFVILLPNTDTSGAVEVAERIQQTISNLAILHPLSTISPYVTTSLGITSMIPTADISPESLISQADQALYLAKNQGRDRFQIYDESPLLPIKHDL